MSGAIAPAGIAALTATLASFADPADGAARMTLLRTLYGVGRRDLPLGRVFEGHVDALHIVHRYGSAAQAAAAAAAARAGAVFGVWNADRADDPIRLEGRRLYGGKAFASGAGLVGHALIGVDVAGGRQLLLVDLDAVPPAIDRDWWRVTGMARSATHRVAWDGAELPEAAWIGAPGDYVRQPWFGGGAIRFTAVQAGGVAGVLDGVRAHLNEAGRAGDPYQAARLAALYGHAQAAADAVVRAGAAWDDDDAPRTLAAVAAARVAVLAAGEAALRHAAAAVGVSAMFADHPLSQAMRDLDVYLRQPGPDAQRMIVGAAVADGLLDAGL